ncbi:MAG TPA: phenylalanine--tRNA ligase beta subunit-related protein [Thermoanaerobaculia bacterium]|jgi:DNA/RNA-binding domain of Phe-tRNA-synthetase-like protein|nr:phenylalanine--tRNA ligase beta subunit-related protein [Thermoanaerobaculia bacterium]
MDPVPFEVRHELPGWELLWFRLQLRPGHDEALAALRREVTGVARANFEGEGLSTHPTVAAVRKLFRAAGTDPTRYRPSSEALIRRLVKGEDLPVIHPFVDLNNCLSVELAVPCCASADGTFAPPVTLRAGRPGETVQSLRGPFNLEGKPLMSDGQGPFSTPITDSERVRVGDGTERVWIVAYLPQGVVDPADARVRFDELLSKAPVAAVEVAGVSAG